MKGFRKSVLIAAASLVSPSPLFACAACFGKSSDPLAHGMNWGIYTLLGFVALMLSTIATFFFVLARRGAAANERKAEEEQEQLSGAEI